MKCLRRLTVLFVLFGIFLTTETIKAQQIDGTSAAESEDQEIQADEEALEKTKEDYLSILLEELELDEVDGYTKEELPERLSFENLVQAMLENEGEEFEPEELVEYVLDLFFYELRTAKPMFIQILSVSLLFAMFGRVLITRQSYVNDLGFFAVYTAIMMLLLNTFLLVNEVVETGLSKMLSFMTAFIPVYATTLLVAGNGSSAGIFYELAFGLIYLLELAMKTVFVPGVHVFVLLQMMDHLFDESKLSRLAELIESGIRVALKLALAGVVGLGVVQSLLAPAKDRLASSGVYQTLQSIPGIGNTFGAAGEILVGCGIMIKNSVGTAALVILLPAFM